MAMVTKNGQIHITNSPKGGKQKGFVTKNGQISILIPYAPADVAAIAATGTIETVIGVALGSISTVMGVAVANISTVMGVDKE